MFWAVPSLYMLQIASLLVSRLKLLAKGAETRPSPALRKRPGQLLCMGTYYTQISRPECKCRVKYPCQDAEGVALSSSKSVQAQDSQPVGYPVPAACQMCRNKVQDLRYAKDLAKSTARTAFTLGTTDRSVVAVSAMREF